MGDESPNDLETIRNALKEVREAFELNRRDDDRITIEETKRFFKLMERHPTDDELIQLFRTYDPEQTGGLDAEALCKAAAAWLDDEQLKKTIREELDHWQEPDYLLAMGELREELAKDFDAKQVDDLVRDAGLARNARVTIGEFQKIMCLAVAMK